MNSIPKQNVSIIGFPMDLGADRRGVDMGPSALRIAGLQTKLESLGYKVDDNGDIKIDHENLRHINMGSVLAQTGVILQDTFLFGGTIRDNIRYARPDASDEEVIQAARDAGIHHDISEMPGGYDMDVAEGANLSGGQKQRIAIARALIKKPRLLFLDEATSSLDIVTEDAIIKTLRQNFQKITTIIISHRINLITDADEILVLDKGEIVERGKHDELIQHKKLYYRFYRQQVDEAEAK